MVVFVSEMVAALEGEIKGKVRRLFTYTRTGQFSLKVSSEKLFFIPKIQLNQYYLNSFSNGRIKNHLKYDRADHDFQLKINYNFSFILKIAHFYFFTCRLHKHPLTQLLYAYQHKIFNEAQPILNQWHYARQKSLQHQISATSQTGDDNQVPTHSPTDDSPGSDVMVGSARIQDRCESSNIRDSRGSKSLSTTAYDVSDFDDLFEVGCDGDDDDDNDGDGDGDDDDDDGDDGDDDGDDVIAHGVVNNTKNSSNCAADNEDSHTLESTNNLDLGSNPSAISSLEDHSDAPVEKSDYICDTGSLLNSPLISLQELDREAILRHLVNITRDTQDYLERLVTMFIVAYDSLDHATGRDCCYSTLEQPFYKPLWNHLLSLFRFDVFT